MCHAREREHPGRHGATRVHLKTVSKATLQKAVSAAWRNTAPKRLAEHFLKER